MHLARRRPGTRTDLAHPVAEVTDEVEALVGELVEVLRPPFADVHASFLHRPDRPGVKRLRVAAGACGFDRAPGPQRERAPPPSAIGRCCRYKGTGSGARPETLDATCAAPRRRAQRRMQRRACPRHQLSAARQLDRVVGVAPVRRATALSRPTRRPAASRGGRRPDSEGASTRSHSSRTRRSLRASSISSCQRSGSAAKGRKVGARTARDAADLRPAERDTSIQIDAIQEGPWSFRVRGALVASPNGLAQAGTRVHPCLTPCSLPSTRMPATSQGLSKEGPWCV